MLKWCMEEEMVNIVLALSVNAAFMINEFVTLTDMVNEPPR